MIALALGLVAVFLQETRPVAQETALEWNRVGVERYQKGEVEAAIEAFEKARALDADDATIRKNLAVALSKSGDAAVEARDAERAVGRFSSAVEVEPEEPRYRLRLARAHRLAGDEAREVEVLEETTKRFPKEVAAWERLGAIRHRQGRLVEAVLAFEKALALEPGRESARSALARARRDLEVEGTYEREGSIHFDFRYDVARTDLVRGSGVVAVILEDAYIRVSQELGVFPQERFQVVLYGGDTFREVTKRGEWVAGLFDGRIRLPVGNLWSERERLRSVATHEVAHAFLSRVAPSIPSWANEGYAQLVEGLDPRVVESRLRSKKGSLLSADELRRSFLEIASSARVQVAYDQSLSLMGWLREGFGHDVFLLYLRSMKETDEPEAFERAYGAPFEEIVERWRLAHRMP